MFEDFLFFFKFILIKLFHHCMLIQDSIFNSTNAIFSITSIKKKKEKKRKHHNRHPKFSKNVCLKKIQ